MKQVRRFPQKKKLGRTRFVKKQTESSNNMKEQRMRGWNNQLLKAHMLLRMNWINSEDFKEGSFLLWEASLVFPATNKDTLQHIVRQIKPSPTNKGCNKREEPLKQANGKDNPSPGTQIISMATVMHAIILDIKLLIVKFIQEEEQSIIHQIKCTLIK